MNDPQIPVFYRPARRDGRAKIYVLAAALGATAAALSLALALLRRR